MIRCAWCGKTIGSKPVILTDDTISHGICEDCKQKLLKELEAENGNLS